jgi:putative membrane protein insertion efficiency factor
LRALTMWLIRSYQWCISPFLGNACRFYPSCSEYTWQAVSRFGALKGCWMGLLRILRCNPFVEGGYDPVPPAVRERRS